jgi:rod shape-determining protein MreC
VSLPDIRQRSGYLLLAVVVGHLILISAQVNSRRGVPLLQAAAFGAYSEVQRITYGVVSGVRGAWNGYVALRGVRAENEALRQQLVSRQIEQQQQRAAAQRTEELRRLLGLREAVKLPTLAAEVVGGSAVLDFRFVTVDRGTADGLAEDMAVISTSGVVGRIVELGRRASKVQLLVDRNAAAGARVERTRAEGVVLGTGEDTLRMEYVSPTAELAVGDALVTSGTDGIYPKGFLIGRVERIERKGMAYAAIHVTPAVRFAALEEVLVVLTPPPDRGEERR